MPATTDDNVRVTGVLVVITPVAVALVLLPLALAPAGTVPGVPPEAAGARLRARRLTGPARHPGDHRDRRRSPR